MRLMLRALALLRVLARPRRAERDLHDELAFHVARETEKLVLSGVPPDEAHRRARARFGSMPLAADQCRDARGTEIIDITVRDVAYAFRTFARAPIAAATIVATVAIGLGLVAAVFTFFSAFFLHPDAVRQPEELYSVERAEVSSRGRFVLTRGDYEAMRRETHVFSDAVAWRTAEGTRVDGRALTGKLVSGNFFQVLGANAARGRTLTPEDDEQDAAVIVLSHRGWMRVLAGDAAAIGRIVRINGIPHEIVGVMPDGFRGLTLGAPDYWAPLSRAASIRARWAGLEKSLGVTIVGRLLPGMPVQTAAAGLTVWMQRFTGPSGDKYAAVLKSRQGTVRNDAAEALVVFVPLFTAFGLILAIGCANVANLLLARGVSRQREIGIRLSLGASRRRIVRQLLTESLLLALAAAGCGLAVSRVALAAASYAAASIMPPEMLENLFVPAADGWVVAFLVAGALASTMLFGLVPALQATRLELVRTMRGELARDARPGRMRDALIVAQVGASALLLIAAAVLLRGSLATAAADVGLRIADTVSIEIPNEPMRTAVLGALTSHPAVASVGASTPPALAAPPPAEASAIDPAGHSRQTTVGYRLASPEYFSVLGVTTTRGRVYTPAEAAGAAAVAVLSESAARQLWPDGNAVGRTLNLDFRSPAAASSRPATVTVVGVVRDVPGFQSADWPAAVVYRPTRLEAAGTTLTLRVRGDVERARAAFFDRLSTIDPALEKITSLQMVAGVELYLLRIFFALAVGLAGLAVVLTVSGLYSVLSYVVEQRRKEIGVRMALGATPGRVTGLVLSQLMRQVVLGLAAGGALAAALARILMAMPDVVGVVRVLDPLAYGAGLLCIVTACLFAGWLPARRAATIDPIATLRQD